MTDTQNNQNNQNQVDLLAIAKMFDIYNEYIVGDIDDKPRQIPDDKKSIVITGMKEYVKLLKNENEQEQDKKEQYNRNLLIKYYNNKLEKKYTFNNDFIYNFFRPEIKTQIKKNNVIIKRDTYSPDIYERITKELNSLSIEDRKIREAYKHQIIEEVRKYDYEAINNKYIENIKKLKNFFTSIQEIEDTTKFSGFGKKQKESAQAERKKFLTEQIESINEYLKKPENDNSKKFLENIINNYNDFINNKKNRINDLQNSPYTENPIKDEIKKDFPYKQRQNYEKQVEINSINKKFDSNIEKYKKEEGYKEEFKSQLSKFIFNKLANISDDVTELAKIKNVNDFIEKYIDENKKINAPAVKDKIYSNDNLDIIFLYLYNNRNNIIKNGYIDEENFKEYFKNFEEIKKVKEQKKTLRNNMIKSEYKSAVKKFEEAVSAGKIEDAKVLLSQATKKIDQACTKGVIVKNTASRKKSNLSKKLNAAMA